MKSQYADHSETPLEAASPREAACRPAGRDSGVGNQTSPRTVIRGESSEGSLCPRPESHPYAACTDWLNCTFPLMDRPDAIKRFYYGFREVVGTDFTPLNDRGRGAYGWKRSYDFGDSKAIFAVGGQRGKAYVSLSGEACARIPNYVWPTFVEYMRDVCGAKITRWDGAADDYEGGHSVDWAVAQYEAGGFSAGGNKPQTRVNGSWLYPDGRGRTLYVGARQNGKLMRIYEKGKQLGDPESPWVRWELEVHNRDRVIPWDVLLQPGRYVAGAYKCTGWIAPEASRIRTHKVSNSISEAVLTDSLRRSYGRHINYLETHGKTPDEIVSELRRDGFPARLSKPRPAD